jgi:site-specific DNA recombinase
MFQRYEVDGYLKITNWLNSSGIPSPTGKTWSISAVCRVLENPIYTGHLVYGRHMKGKERVRIEAFGDHPPLIDMAIWERVERVRTARKEMRPRQRSDKFGYALSGVLRCAHCGVTMSGKQFNGRRRGRPAPDGETTWKKRIPKPGYVCSTYVQKRVCLNVTIFADELEDKFITELESLTEPTALREILEAREVERNQRQQDTVEIRRSLEAQILVYDGAIAEARKGWLEDKVISVHDYNDIKEEYTRKKADLEAQLAATPPSPTTLKNLDVVIPQIRELRRMWPFGDVAERKAFALSICEALGLWPYLSKDRVLELHPKGWHKNTAAL